MVVGHHAASSIVDFVGTLPHPVQTVLDYGYLGVDFFFVLSGFIIYYTTRERYSPGQFAYRRLVRIFVPYLPVGLGLAALYVLLPSLSASDRSFSWLATLTLLPANAPPALSVAWTLQHELVFYALFCLFMAFRAVLSGMIIWSAAIIAAAPFDLPLALDIPLGLMNLEFGFGALAAWIVTRGVRPPSAFVVLAAGACVAAFAFVGGSREASVLIGAGIAFLMPSMCRAELDGRIRVSSAALFMGAASYAIYLVHNPALSVLARIAARLDMSPMAALLPLIAVSTACGIVYYWVYERSALRAARAVERSVLARRFAPVP